MSIIIIGEIGINHNGDMAICKQLIDVAKDAGADCDVADRDCASVDSSTVFVAATAIGGIVCGVAFERMGQTRAAQVVVVRVSDFLDDPTG